MKSLVSVSGLVVNLARRDWTRCFWVSMNSLVTGQSPREFLSSLESRVGW